MEQLFKLLLYLHIAAGTLALLTGPLSMANRKGGKQHRLTGKLFFYAMIVVSVTAVTIAAMPAHHNPFLLVIGVFSAYLVSSGYRILYLKGLARGQKPRPVDWVISITMAAFAFYFVYAGLAGIINSSFSSNNIVSVVFGSIALVLVAQDILKYTKPPEDRSFWLYDHIGRMIGGNTAAFTAFLVVNNTLLPPLVAWLAPTVIGGVITSFFTVRYKLKARAGRKAGELV